jgi:L-ascorbate metabolism protein UlaG (beta-lactamase superfamily)
MAAGRELIAEIENAAPEQGTLVFWWLGQQSWVVRTAKHTIWIDPFLAPGPRRQTPPLVGAGELTGADLILGTHDHRDHIDRVSLPAILEASAQARLVVPRGAAATLPQDGVEPARMLPIDDGVSHRHRGMRVTAIRARHESFDWSEEYGYPHLQYVVECDGVAIHTAGDTLLFEGMLSRLSAWDLTVTFLPINGRDAARYARGCMGNMTWQEAADLAGDLRARMTCPAHYEMFADNAQDPAPFRAYMEAKYPGLACWVGEPGTAVTVRS